MKSLGIEAGREVLCAPGSNYLGREWGNGWPEARVNKKRPTSGIDLGTLFLDAGRSLRNRNKEEVNLGKASACNAWQGSRNSNLLGNIGQEMENPLILEMRRRARSSTIKDPQ